MSNFGRAGLGCDWYTTQRSNFMRESLAKEEAYMSRWHKQEYGVSKRAEDELSASRGSISLLPSILPSEGDEGEMDLSFKPTALTLQEDVAAWTSYRGSFRDPSPHKARIDRNHFRPKTDRGDYQEQCIKQGTGGAVKKK